MKIVVLDGYTENPGDLSWEGLEKLGEVTVYDRTSYVEDPIIAQRIGSVKDADTIIVMDDGRITGVGTHEELLKNNEEYREICSSQTDGKEA